MSSVLQPKETVTFGSLSINDNFTLAGVAYTKTSEEEATNDIGEVFNLPEQSWVNPVVYTIMEEESYDNWI